MSLSPSARNLTIEEYNWLLPRLSTDDKKMLNEQGGRCSTQMLMYRGVPLAAFVTGSLYYARKNLPEQLRVIGPKTWKGYLGYGILAFFAGGMSGMGTCAARLQPTIAMLYEKYRAHEMAQHGAAYPTSGGGPASYNAIREAHRRGGQQRPIPGHYPRESETLEEPEAPKPDAVRPIRYGGDIAWSGGGQQGSAISDVPFMSGTPYSSAGASMYPDGGMDSLPKDKYAEVPTPSKGTRYGDVGFS